MSINEKIIKTLSKIGYPIWYLSAKEDSDIYFTFNFADEKGYFFSDDAPEFDLYSIQIHLFHPLNFNNIKIKKDVKKALYSDGFTYPRIIETIEDDCVHIIFLCEKEEKIIWQKQD